MGFPPRSMSARLESGFSAGDRFLLRRFRRCVPIAATVKSNLLKLALLLSAAAAALAGLAAINISKAGAGVVLPPGAKMELPAAAARTGSDVLLHIFPENIAKSIADGQVLQVVVFSIIFGIALALVDERKRRPILAF